MGRSQSPIVFCREIPPRFTEADLKEAAAPAGAIGFPKSLVFRGRQANRGDDEQSFAALYFPVFETFVDATNCRKLTYLWIWGGTFHVDVLHTVQSGWLLYKFESGRLLWYVSAYRYEDAFTEAITRGLEANMSLQCWRPAFARAEGFWFVGGKGPCQSSTLGSCACGKTGK